jgi:vacuolar-type H+-ATPase subunit E/Vma4
MNNGCAALLHAARAEAAAIRAEGEASAGRMLAAAAEEAGRIRARAREQGAREGAAMLGADRSRARKQARATVLAARRDGYQALRAAALDAVLRLRDDPRYPRLHDALSATARRALGRGARLRDAAEGGVVAERNGRRLDLSLTGFADRAVDACADELYQP